MRWLLADAEKKGVEATALSKCVWGLRCQESWRRRVSIEMKKIKSIRSRTVVKKGMEMESHLAFVVAACRRCEEGSGGNGAVKVCLGAEMSGVPATSCIN